jgi:hypothetical protein
MAAADVEEVCRWMWRHCYIRAAVAAATVSAEQIEQLDAAVAEAGEGPLYFNVVMMLYEKWADENRPGLSPDSDEGGQDLLPSTDEEQQDWADMPPQTHAGTRRTGVVRIPRPSGSGARMAALLAGLASI